MKGRWDKVHKSGRVQGLGKKVVELWDEDGFRRRHELCLENARDRKRPFWHRLLDLSTARPKVSAAGKFSNWALPDEAVLLRGSPDDLESLPGHEDESHHGPGNQENHRTFQTDAKHAKARRRMRFPNRTACSL